MPIQFQTPLPIQKGATPSRLNSTTPHMFKFRASKLSATASSSSLRDIDNDSNSLSQSSDSSQSFHFQPVLTSDPSLSQPKLGRPFKIQATTPSREVRPELTVTERKRGRPPGTGRHQKHALALREDRAKDCQSGFDYPVSKKRRREESQPPEARKATSSAHKNKSSEKTAIDLTAAPPEVLPFPDSTEGTDITSPELLLDSEVDDDEDVGLAYEGLGMEDGEDGDEDEDEDDVTHSPSDSNTNANHHRRAPNALPSWLQNEYERCVQASGPENRKHDNRPPLYRDSESFYFPRPAKFFILTRNQQVATPVHLYDYSFFLWDPECLLSAGISCPNCHTKLHRHGNCKRPRRFVDFERTVWVIGYRYKCPTCLNPKSKKHTVTFQSWNPRILAMLPKWLSSEFPAHLSHRSGLSHGVFMFMRTCFQHRFGAKQFANALRVQQLQRYDELQLQYLYYMWESKSMITLLGHKIELFPPFQDRSPRGFAGFIPSAQWLRDTYDDFIAIHVQDMNQHTAMLTADIIAIDHSFKVTKQVTKINGVQVFVGLLTMTNEKGEIRLCNLVASKSHSQFEIALRKLSASLAMYGHLQPSICYTDNMADQPFMEQVLPSLREGVNPVEYHSNLEPLTIPSDVSIIYPIQTSSQVDNAMRSILQLLPDHDDGGGVVIGLDAEYNVEVSSRGSHVIGAMLAGSHLPTVLKQLLCNPRILKVGRNVAIDLKYLEQATSSPANSFVGAVDLARLAKERLVIKCATMGLADLCACTLGKRLNKNVSERVSALWENETLTRTQIEYAALDAYASLRIYEQLMLISVPSPLSSNAPPIPGDPVLLFGDDKSRLVARGRISEHYKPRHAYDGINFTELRCVVEITDIYVPGAVISTHRKRSLESFGSAPFHVVCLKSHLRIPHTTMPDPPQPPVSTSSQVRLASTVPNIDDDSAAEQVSDGNIGMLLLNSIDSSDHEGLPSSSLDHFALDPKSKADGDEMFKAIAEMTWAPDMRSRVKKDAFHVFDMFYISTSHGLRVDFSRALRDAIFIPDPADRNRITAWASSQNPPLTWEYLTIPPPEQLYRLVELVFRTYGPLKDVKTGSPLFNTAAWSVSRNILELIRKGYLSDPPGLALYTQIGIDTKAGGVHRHLIEHLPKHGVSVRHVGTFNSTGKPWTGHYSIWLTNELHEMLLTLRSNNLISKIPTGIIPAGWVNGNFYIPTTEVMGILPIPEKIRRDSGMLEYDVNLHRAQTHWFIASLQGTQRPVLPIHNKREEDLFRDLILTNTGASEPRWDNIVLAWNTTANNDSDVSYKIIEHLRLYYNGEWKSLANIKQTLAQTAEDRRRAKKHVHDPLRMKSLPAALEAPLSLHHVPSGLRSLESTPLPQAPPVSPHITQSVIEGTQQEQPSHNPDPIATSASSLSQDPVESASLVMDRLAGNRYCAMMYLKNMVYRVFQTSDAAMNIQTFNVLATTK
ncbi:hypothetical protein FB446DRAFT_699599 [Lentinula raphanica]|nr:hypothetical protein FB446DRAFT_699599 [Lentinula raphanica]